MADLDAELLALAGDTSDEEQAQSTPQKASTPQPPAPTATSAGTIQKKATMAKPKRSKRRDDSEDEGEASSASEVASAAMSESDAESAESDEEGPLFPIENKFYSEKDQAEILALPEVEREAILAERATILERKQQDNILKRLYQGYKTTDDKAKAAKKRKAGAAGLEEGERKSGRQRTTLAGRRVGEASAPLEAYKAQREKKDQLEQQRRADIAAGRGRRRESGSAESEDEVAAGSDAEWDARGSGDADESADLVDYNRVLVGRQNFALVCFYPGFEQAVKDCFVRVAVGPDPQTGETCYRMAKIVGIHEGKPYALEGKNGKPFVTNQYVIASVGNAKRDWPFIFCSMTRFSERELARYKAMVNNDGLALPKKKALAAKIDDINRLVNHTFTEAELQEKLKRSGVLQQKVNAIERQTLLVKRQEAENFGRADLVTQIDAELQALEGPKLAFGTTLAKAAPAKPAGLTQQQRLAEINRANRKANTENVRRAQLAEQRAQAAHRRAVERGEAVADPFARVKVMAKTHFDVNNPQRINGQKPTPSQVAAEAKTAAAVAATTNGVNGKAKTAAEDGVDGAELKVELKNATFDWAEYDQMAAFAKVCRGRNGEKASIFKRKPCVHEVLASYDFGLDDLVHPEVKAEDESMA